MEKTIRGEDTGDIATAPQNTNFQRKPFQQQSQQQQKSNFTRPQQQSQQTQQFNSGSGSGNPIVNLQVFEPAKPKPKPSTIDPTNFLPMMTQNPYYPAQMAQMGNMFYPLPYSYAPAVGQPMTTASGQLPIIKNYNINTTGPQDDHMKLSMIYEDVLPKLGFNATSSTIDERLAMLNFVRSIMLKHHDGEDISLSGTEDNNLLSYLKFLDLNPYSSSTFSNNPYKGLPKDMLIYRSCYPIRHDPVTGSVKCATESIGMNVRLYKMTLEDVNINKSEKDTYVESDLWREVAYYEYIREDIIKKKICPNFVSMYAYFISSKSGIDFNRLNTIRGESERISAPKYIYKDKRPIIPQQTKVRTKDGSLVDVESFLRDKKVTLIDSKRPMIKDEATGKIVNIDDWLSQLGAILDNPVVQPHIPKQPQAGGGNTIYTDMMFDPPKGTPMINPIFGTSNYTTNLQDYIERQAYKEEHKFKQIGTYDDDDENMATMIDNPQSYQGHAMVVLTEAPTYSLHGWGSNAYYIEGNVRKMTYSGYYHPRVWKSIIFQMMAALYVMQIYKIYFNNMDIANNFYIKDVKTTTTVTSYWKYIIDGIDYYIPNFGYLLMIDSNFKDIVKEERTLGTGQKATNKKIYSTIYNLSGGANGVGVDEDEIEKYCYSAVSQCISGTNFSVDFINKGGNKPPDEIITFMQNIEGSSRKQLELYNTDLKKHTATPADPITPKPSFPKIGDIIFDKFGFYMNNRIGTFLKEGEIEHVRKNVDHVLKKGEIVVQDFGEDSYKFVAFIGYTDKTEQIAVVLTRGDSRTAPIERKPIPVSEIKLFADSKNIEQNYKPNEAVMGEEDLLETYTINYDNYKK